MSDELDFRVQGWVLPQPYPGLMKSVVARAVISGRVCCFRKGYATFSTADLSCVSHLFVVFYRTSLGSSPSHNDLC